MPIRLLLFYAFLAASVASSVKSFSPHDNFLINCGSTSSAKLSDGRIFISDRLEKPFLSSIQNITVSSVPDAERTPPIYLSARIFIEEGYYSFPMTDGGWHWIRLHFWAIKNPKFDLQQAMFSVTADKVVLLYGFSIKNNTGPFSKEFLVYITTKHFSLKFSPSKDSVAFINALEILSAPESLITEVRSDPSAVGHFPRQSTYETMFRLNMGGPVISSHMDPLWRTWFQDLPHLQDKLSAKSVSVSPTVINYTRGESALIAPAWVYASATEMADTRITNRNFNLTWEFEVDLGFDYLFRLHFCDIVSRSLNDLYFNVYISGNMVISRLDLSALTKGLAIPYYQDILVDSFKISEPVLLQISPISHYQTNGSSNAIINGLEVFKLRSSNYSLDGGHGDDKAKPIVRSKPNTMAVVGVVLMFGVFICLGTVIMWKKCLIPSAGGYTLFRSEKPDKSSDSHKRESDDYSRLGPGKVFSLAEVHTMTNNFDKALIIGEGGFGSVYQGRTEDGIKVAVKRASPESKQGLSEYQSEIQSLCEVRHNNITSLVGHCDEADELILIYEFMEGGQLSDHLYGNNSRGLPWIRRLQIAIGAARGLHYLHTGTSRGIIHRDVKSSNILLDEDGTAKVSDFGLAKVGSKVSQTHVTTLVRGSFGYLDPEYFSTKKLNNKSDVYSFGVVLLELACARPALDNTLPYEQANLAEWALKMKRIGKVEKILDPYLASKFYTESMKKFIATAEMSLEKQRVNRPSMEQVLYDLESALQLEKCYLKGKTEDEAESSIASSAAVAASISEKRPVALP